MRSEWVKVTTDPPQKVVLDGEIIGEMLIEIRCVPGGLTIFVPVDPEIQSEEKLDNLPGVDVELK